MKEWDFTITEYSVHYGMSQTTAKERLNALVMAGLAKKLFRDEDTGTSRRVFRVKLQGAMPSDPFNLVKRKVEPMPPNEWMKGALISDNSKKTKPESKKVWGQRWRTTDMSIAPEDIKKIESKWVGLTDEEIDKFMPYCHTDQDLSDFRTFAFEIEAKLKEKNG